MRILRDLPTGKDAGPMTMRGRWLCGLILVVTSPIWLFAMLVAGVVVLILPKKD